jgi:hypothetical protein
MVWRVGVDGRAPSDELSRAGTCVAWIRARRVLAVFGRSDVGDLGVELEVDSLSIGTK